MKRGMNLPIIFILSFLILAVILLIFYFLSTAEKSQGEDNSYKLQDIELPLSVEVQIDVPNSPHIYILKDDGIDEETFWLKPNKFYEQYPQDDYDFMGIHFLNSAPGISPPAFYGTQSPGTNGVWGGGYTSGKDAARGFGSDGRLLGLYVDTYNFNEMYVQRSPALSPMDFLDNYYFILIFHELTHYWGVNTFNFTEEMREASPSGGHWEFFTGSYLSIRPTTRIKYIEKNDGYYFENDCFSEPREHDFDLYSMGLIDAGEVNEKLIITSKPGGLESLMCGEVKVTNDFIKKVFTIQDFIDVLGPRVPSYADSQKDFNIAFIMFVPQGENMTQKQRDAFNWIANKFPTLWYKATKGRSTMNGVIPQDLTPPIISKVQTKIINQSISISWETNEPSSGFVISSGPFAHPQTSFFTQNLSVIYPHILTNPPKFFTTHRINMESDEFILLNPNEEYNITLVSIDENYNMAVYSVGSLKI